MPEVDELVDLDVQGVVREAVGHRGARHGEVDAVAVVWTNSLEVWVQLMRAQTLTWKDDPTKPWVEKKQETVNKFKLWIAW